MVWIYSIIIWIFICLDFVVPDEGITMLFIGLEIGVLIGQVIFVINEIRRYK